MIIKNMVKYFILLYDKKKSTNIKMYIAPFTVKR